MATLDRVTIPVSRPSPTATREKMAPRVESVSSCLRPTRYGRIVTCGVSFEKKAYLNEYNRRECHENVHDCYTEGDIWAELRQGLGKDVVTVVQDCTAVISGLPWATDRKWD